MGLSLYYINSGFVIQIAGARQKERALLKSAEINFFCIHKIEWVESEYKLKGLQNEWTLRKLGEKVKKIRIYSDNIHLIFNVFLFFAQCA
jgi:hypothetical protein